jgi:exodeoxyribonuclease VII small subunit
MSPREPKTSSAAGDPASFEAALVRLEELVAELEGGDVPLEKSLLAFEEGQRLIKFCEQKLQAAETSLKQLAGDAADALRPDNPAAAE